MPGRGLALRQEDVPNIIGVPGTSVKAAKPQILPPEQISQKKGTKFLLCPLSCFFKVCPSSYSFFSGPSTRFSEAAAGLVFPSIWSLSLRKMIRKQMKCVMAVMPQEIG